MLVYNSIIDLWEMIPEVGFCLTLNVSFCSTIGCLHFYWTLFILPREAESKYAQEIDANADLRELNADLEQSLEHLELESLEQMKREAELLEKLSQMTTLKCTVERYMLKLLHNFSR